MHRSITVVAMLLLVLWPAAQGCAPDGTERGSKSATDGQAAASGVAAATGTKAVPADVRRVHVFVSGRVQGVGFRNFTYEAARKLKLAGWVKNLSDGRVEAVIEGPRADVESLLKEIGHGPPSAKVDKVEMTDETPTSEFKDFAVR